MVDNDCGKAGGAKDIIEATTGLVQAIPIYQDAIQPAAQELGKALGTVAKTVNIALAPVSALVWGFDHMKEFIETKVADRLKNVPPEKIVTPKANIAGPAMDALRYTGHEPSLSDMYANLLASAMNESTQEFAHPAFVEIIKQLSAVEARLLKSFESTPVYPVLDIRAELKDSVGGIEIYQNYTHLWKFCGMSTPGRLPASINNLCRLGLLEIPEDKHLINDDFYTPLESDEFIGKLIVDINLMPDRSHRLIRKLVRVTGLGQQFVDACVKQSVSQ
ncbi:DUF4393 domain-containing protein [Pseudomonas putida]|uniref:DUF4393 domain-containing protein n=1 Tax=Pseudomonas putida TaxID=303 RepID=UPI000819361D|nr:DUF4393 domain-containing protein [Pseudomonas putida]OCT20876.1 hypothetical protein A6E24_19585 [Pseudomonas putida]OCT29183.1 hypothetical protein A6E23_06110 [Pseudomonas putida]OCT35481.1 hypothetical protein A6E20_20080 [Pseudomonas putida]OCT39533.1 hypothetical protein A6E19_08235 [Pseudomonas putida]